VEASPTLRLAIAVPLTVTTALAAATVPLAVASTVAATAPEAELKAFDKSTPISRELCEERANPMFAVVVTHAPAAPTPTQTSQVVEVAVGVVGHNDEEGHNAAWQMGGRGAV